MEKLSFGEALILAKAGHKIQREGWNGKNMFVYYVPGGDYPSQTDIAKSIGETMHYEPYLALYNVRGTVNTWSPSINDALARDWKVIE